MKRIVLILFFAQMAFSIKSMAQGDLMVTPTRVVFEGNKQKEEISLLNMGKDTATFTISFVQRCMKEDGSFVTIVQSDSGQLFADSYLRVFPRTVTLAPREPQLIIMQFRRKSDMTDGEYRSHLYFRSEKKQEALGMEKEDKDKKQVSVQLIPIFGVSIPIIIRTGVVQVSSTLSDIKLETLSSSAQNLKFTIHRSGNISLYGDIIVDYIPEKGKPYQVGALGGVGVYTGINKRYMVIKLKDPSGKLPEKGKLRVVYTSKGDGKTVVYATGDYIL